MPVGGKRCWRGHGVAGGRSTESDHISEAGCPDRSWGQDARCSGSNHSSLVIVDIGKGVDVTLLLSRSDVQKALGMVDAMRPVERGFIEFGQGGMDMP